MNISYVITEGEFSDNNKELIFLGKQEERFNKAKDKMCLENSEGKLLFSAPFKSGRVSFDITFTDTNEHSLCGVVFDYENIDNKEYFYQFVLRNYAGFLGLDYFNGGKWEIKGFVGRNNCIVKGERYRIALELKGNVVKLFVNGVLLYTYTSFIPSASTCGITVSNNANVVIENISIESKRSTVFSIMKFEKDFDELYSDVIVPKCEQFGYRSVRADECYTTTAIIQDIIKEISNASVIIADVTMDNPNVFYELGYAHALKKPTILLADVDKRDKLPFDISGQRVVFYNNSIGGKKDIDKKLGQYFENINAN